MLNTKNSIELFPNIKLHQTTDCCDINDVESADCCTAPDDTASLDEYQELKRRLKETFEQEVMIHVYDYSLPMDRALAKRKLKSLFEERGFAHIQSDKVFEFATPAVVINGKLLSFAQQVQYESLEKALRSMNTVY
ncbi:ArsD-related vicinal cysteine protein VcpD [Paenibacillus amylolyticus]|uniref:ArsD-related vicinal cysteine protein VcpD n=1 Tax=Paenibacillus amylolyticus TaxID=1451 RepID=UPI003D981176